MNQVLRNLAVVAAALMIAQVSHGQTYSGGDGTEANPFKISCQADLATMARRSVYYSETFAGIYFEMVNDITFSGTESSAIGTIKYNFEGSFDGKGHSIKNFNVTVNNTPSLQGLFGYVGENGVVKNLSMESPEITGKMGWAAAIAISSKGLVDNCHVTNATFKGNTSTGAEQGGVVGYLLANGTVSNCTFTGNVTANCGFGGIVGCNEGLIENCSTTANITSVAERWSAIMMGGIVAKNSATVRNCRFEGSMTGNFQNQMGGIAGRDQQGTIANCANMAHLAASGHCGGIVASAAGTSISDCYNLGRINDLFYERDSVNVSYAADNILGGLAGLLSENATITRSWNGGFMQGISTVGGLVGDMESGSIIDCYNAATVYNVHSARVSGIAAHKIAGNAVMQRVLSYGTIYNASVARTNGCEFAAGNYSLCSIENSYYDSQVAGWANTPGGLTTVQLTSGEAIDGFDTAVWTFQAGMYPRLQATAGIDAAKALATPYYLATGEHHARVMSDITLGTCQGVTWSLAQATHSTIEGNTVKITQDDEQEIIWIQASCGDFSRQGIVTVNPNLFIGEGTEQSPYQIGSYADLCALAEATTTQGQIFTGEHFALLADIDMENDEAFTIIGGNASNPFRGHFDGRGHSIKNWKIPASSEQRALFGNVAGEASIKNLTIDASCTLTGVNVIAPLALNLDGTLENCRNLAAVTATAGDAAGLVYKVQQSGKIIDCYNAGDVTSLAPRPLKLGDFIVLGYESHVAGLVADNFGIIDGCQNDGDIRAEIEDGSTYAGGLVSYNWKTITNSINTGLVSGVDMVGGIAASATSASMMNKVLSLGMVKFSADDGSHAGSIAGEYNSSAQYPEVYFDRQISILGNVESDSIVGLTSRELTQLNLDGDKWVYPVDRYPMLAKWVDEPRAIVGSLPILLGDSITRADATGSFELVVAEGAKWNYDRDAFRVAYDINDDRRVDVSDVNSAINAILKLGDSYLTASDVNGDGKVDVSDVNSIINYVLGLNQKVVLCARPGVSGDYDFTDTLQGASHTRTLTVK